MFGTCVARWLDDAWVDLGRPDPFVVIEGGSGPGRLCRDIFLAADRCREALRYVMVERSTTQRQEGYERVTATCFPGVDEAPVAAVADLPAQPFDRGVVLANELLDNLPPRLMTKRDGGWVEVYVSADSLVEQPAPAAAVAMADRLVPSAAEGATVPLQLKSAVWIGRALAAVPNGRVLAFDYGVERTSELAALPREEWLRTYRAHRRGPLDPADAGQHDITCDVAFDQLPQPARLSRQADWLRDQGLDDLLGDARARWEAAAAQPDAAAVAARSVLDEAAALVHRPGLGDFFAAEWKAPSGS